MGQLAVGTRIKTTANVQMLRLVVDFPGWGAPNYADHLLPIPGDLLGTVTTIESHGIAPFTRYTVKFDDGTRSSGMTYGKDFVAVQ